MPNANKGQRKKERRNLPRNIIKVRQRVTVCFGPEQKESVQTVIMDLTEKGASLFSESHFPLNTKVLIKCKTKQMKEEISVFGNVTWCELVPSTNRIIKVEPNFSWKFGVHFNPQSDSEKRAITSLMEALVEKVESKSEKKNDASKEDKGSATPQAAPVPQAA